MDGVYLWLSMNTDVIDDLKQFIVATTSQQTSDIRDDIHEVKINAQALGKRIDDLDIKLSTKLDDVMQAVGVALDASNNSLGDQITDHETRITKLEHRAAT